MAKVKTADVLKSIDQRCRLIFDGMETMSLAASELEEKVDGINESMNSMRTNMTESIKQAVTEQMNDIKQLVRDQFKDLLKGAQFSVKAFKQDIDNIIPECIANINEKITNVIDEQRDNIYTDLRISTERDYKKYQQESTSMVVDLAVRVTKMNAEMTQSLTEIKEAASKCASQPQPQSQAAAPKFDSTDLLTNIPILVAETLKRMAISSDAAPTSNIRQCVHQCPAKSHSRAMAARTVQCEQRAWLGMPYCSMHVHLHATEPEVKAGEERILANTDYKAKIAQVYKARIANKNDVNKSNHYRYIERLYHMIKQKESELVLKTSCGTQTEGAACTCVAANHVTAACAATETPAEREARVARESKEPADPVIASGLRRQSCCVSGESPEYNHLASIENMDTENGKYIIARAPNGLPVGRLLADPRQMTYSLEHMLGGLTRIQIRGWLSSNKLNLIMKELRQLCECAHKYHEDREARLNAGVMWFREWSFSAGNINLIDYNKYFEMPNELPNQHVLKEPVPRLRMTKDDGETRQKLEVTDSLHETLLFCNMTYFDTLEGEIIQSPLPPRLLEMLVDQTMKYKTRNMGLILDTDGKLYSMYREVSSIHNQLGVYQRRILNILRGPEKIVEWKQHGDLQQNMRACEHSKNAYNKQMMKLAQWQDDTYRNAHALRYNLCGFLYDAITGYIFYPTKFGTVCIGVAFVDEIEAHDHIRTGDRRIKYNHKCAMTTHVGMLNRFEVAHCISLNLNFLCPHTGRVVYFNKIDEATDSVVYNKNYYKYDPNKPDTWFEAQNTPPIPIDPELTIPLTLYTRSDVLFYTDKEKTDKINDPLNPSPHIKGLTGTNCTRREKEFHFNYDPDTKAIQYLRVPNLMYSLGQLKVDDPMERCRAASVLEIVRKRQSFNKHLVNKRPVLENYDARNLLVMNNECVNKSQVNMLEEVIPTSQHHHLLDLNDAGYIMDPLTKYLMTIKGGTNICVGEMVVSPHIDKVVPAGSVSWRLHFDAYELDSDATKVCTARRMNYLDPNTKKIVYYSYYDPHINRIMYNLNYFSSPNACIVPSFQPPECVGLLQPNEAPRGFVPIAADIVVM